VTTSKASILRDINGRWADIARAAIARGIRADVADHGAPKTLVSESHKGDPAEGFGFKNAFFYGSPAGEAFAEGSSKTACPWAGDCVRVCLITNSGQIRLSAARRAGVQRMALYYGDRAAFYTLMAAELRLLAARVAKKGLRVAYRPDGATDLFIARGLVKHDPTIQDIVELYDYTKSPERALDTTGGVKTYSISEKSDPADIRRILDAGGRVTIVTDRRKSDPIPPTWFGYPTVNGDEHDLVFLDPAGSVRVLAMKYSNKGGHAEGVRMGTEFGFVQQMTEWVN